MIFEHGFARIERMIVCDGVAKIRGKLADPCSRGLGNKRSVFDGVN